MKIRTVRRHFIDSFRSIKRNGWMTLAAVSAVTVTLFIVGVLFTAIFNVSHISSQIEKDVKIRVEVDTKANKSQEAKLKEKIQKLEDVNKVTFSSKSKELAKITKTYNNKFKMFSGDANPLSDVFVVETTSPSKTITVAKKIRDMNNVTQAQYGGDQTKKLFSFMNGVRFWGVVSIVILVAIALFLISNVIRLTILSRSNEIQAMRLVGATSWYIRWPFLLEGAETGILGSIIPIIIINWGYNIIYSQTMQSLSTVGYSLYAPGGFLFQVDLLLILLAIVIGSLGSLVSMRRFLKI
ncbi:permease-like cell division protein FtsX [Xylocopilactobacillus apicola]|uniref:Cell division protein FtsX n=1 Tax=Xylocopilactobacillus apicola TaxID=2932184 RepID=A0AAU9DHZ9_9LACO|nr:permease-like cell division protein FtsX [Xylocopilactobacillus apicola]BDR57946.1 cell division protein FtsX [Xylocopilactobacillus apicola]